MLDGEKQKLSHFSAIPPSSEAQLPSLTPGSSVSPAPWEAGKWRAAASP